jgi:uncharacterized surface protein with fasciclin (FAS1) repeats
MKKLLKLITATSLILAFAITLNSQALNAQDQGAQGDTVVEVVEGTEEASDFADLLSESGFASVLQEQGPYTVLAPSNEALEASGTNVDELKQNPQKVQGLVQGHLYQGELPSDKVESMLDVSVEKSDNSASNGTVHVVDKVVKKGGQQQ